MSAENWLDEIVQTVTRGGYGFQTNPEFVTEMQKIEGSERNFVTKVYDSGTLFIINDESHELVPRYKFVKKK